MPKRNTSRHKLETRRLILRQWRPRDITAFAEINGDAKVMEFYHTGARDLAASKQTMDCLAEHIRERGYGLWALELKSTGALIGFAGLQYDDFFEAHFTPCVEAGWRIAREHWGQGYAPEAAAEALRDGFERLRLKEIVAMASKVNHKSVRVMQKLGMTHSPADDFEHPLVPKRYRRLRPFCLYRLSAANWQARQGQGR